MNSLRAIHCLPLTELAIVPFRHCRLAQFPRTLILEDVDKIITDITATYTSVESFGGQG
jgi:hypothetical protein